MSIGTDDGQYFENHMEYLLSRPSRMPLEAPTEPTGALESSRGTQVAMNLKTTTGVTITDEDIDKGMGLGMAFSGGGLSTKTDVIKDAALRIKGEIFTGANHYEAYEKAIDKLGKNFPYKMDEGFTTNIGEFVSRERALEVSGIKDSAQHPELFKRSSEYWRNRSK